MPIPGLEEYQPEILKIRAALLNLQASINLLLQTGNYVYLRLPGNDWAGAIQYHLDELSGLLNKETPRALDKK